MMRPLTEIWADESGASAIEYGLLVAVIGVGLVYTLTNLASSLVGVFEAVDTQVRMDR
jgi:pilus assembly protein Flp/PilA